MNKLIMAGMAACLTTGAWAETADEPVDNPNIRFSANGFGRIGMKGKGDLGNFKSDERGEIWGVNFDVQYNLLSNDKFSLWTGLGFGYAPKQDFVTLDKTVQTDVLREDYAAKVELETYDLHVLLCPEYNLTDSFALGVRLGAGVTWYKAAINSSYSLTLPGFSGEVSDKISERDHVLYGLVGVQASWNFAANASIFAYCDARFSDDVEFKDGGERYGEIEASSLDVGVGLSVAF